MLPTNAADRWWDGFEKRLRSRLRNCDCSRSAEQWRTYEPRRANDPEQPELCKETTTRKLIQRVARTGQWWASSLSGEYSPRARPLGINLRTKGQQQVNRSCRVESYFPGS